MHDVIAVTLILTSLCILVMTLVGVFCYFLGSGRIFSRSLQATTNWYGSASYNCQSKADESISGVMSRGGLNASSGKTSVCEMNKSEQQRLQTESRSNNRTACIDIEATQQQQHAQQRQQHLSHEDIQLQQQQQQQKLNNERSPSQYSESYQCHQSALNEHKIEKHNGEQQDCHTFVVKSDEQPTSFENVHEMVAAASTTLNNHQYTTSLYNNEVEPVSAGLQRAISCDSMTSEASVDLDFLDEGRKNGQIEFIVALTGNQSQVMINMIGAKDLELDPITGSLDSCVRVWLSTRDDVKHQTKIIKGTNQPRYNETFVFPLAASSSSRAAAAAATEALAQFQVYSCDKYARYRLLGEAEFRLSDIDLTRPVKLTLNLHDMDERPEDYGDVLFSMSYLPTAERLTLVISKARNLRWPVNRVVGDCCIKAYLLHNGKKVSRKKTSHKREDRNPIFNESMCFSLPQESLNSVQIKISVIVFLPEGGGACTVGHVITGPNTSGTELAHWTETMNSLRKPITMWHRLRK